MHNDAVNAIPLSLTQQADAALHAASAAAKAENAKQIEALVDETLDSHVAEHIRGIVAWTVAHLSDDASAATRANTEHWQQWALAVAQGMERGQPAVA